MTRREREQVVELLRCAADLSQRKALPFNEAAIGLDIDEGRAYWLAGDALDSVGEPGSRWCSVESALEAAARVEEGSWP